MNIRTINRLNNEYRAYVYEAETIRSMKKEASREEGLNYQRAAQICGQLATMTTGAEAQRWMRCQTMCQEKMREIWKDLFPEEETEAEAEPAASDEPEEEKKPAPAKPAAKKKAAAKDDVSDATVEKWFKPDPGYGFDEVAGMDDVKKLLSDCVRDVSMSALNDYLGMPTVQSFFFYGPPGCGKTFIIEAFAHELMQQGYKYMSLATADIHSKFSGEADKIVRRAFEEAAKNAPCILFMDEVDGICQNRSIANLSDFNMQLTTTFLTSFNQLQKANRDKKSVIFIGATNYPANVDTAMLDRVELVQIPLPDQAARAHAFRKKFGDIIQLEDGFDWSDMADCTECYNQRDINRVSTKLLNLIRTSVAEGCADGESAVTRLQNGSFRLTRELFETAKASYVPSPKDDIERSLNEFEEQMRTL
ncbi:MAG: ATP-binding protein [Clostridiales bacterium]|nr:ATP-binding protein [Clostridiales bacterium]